MAEEWTRRCTQHLVRANERVAGGARIEVNVSALAFNPSVRFRARVTGGGTYEGGVEHGRWPCIDFDRDDDKGPRTEKFRSTKLYSVTFRNDDDYKAQAYSPNFRFRTPEDGPG